MNISEKDLQGKTKNFVIKSISTSIKEAAKVGAWSTLDDTDDFEDHVKILKQMAGGANVPLWFSMSTNAVKKIIQHDPAEGCECALTLLASVNRACCKHEEIAAKTMILEAITESGFSMPFPGLAGLSGGMTK